MPTLSMSLLATDVDADLKSESSRVECFGNCSESPNSQSSVSPLSTGLKAVPMVIIIAAALFGNGLVIVSLLRFSKLRVVLTNYFLVSLAFADFLVALLVMPFNLLSHLTGAVWPFSLTVCNLFNANDVLFSTASLLHLCCISMDRYYAIVTPMSYERRITRRRVAVMLATCWLAAILISYIPIFTGIYTTPENLRQMVEDPRICRFSVNPVYAVVSSVVSFWIPCFTMSIVYLRIFLEARRQERKMYKLKKMAATRMATAVTNNCESSAAPKDSLLDDGKQATPSLRRDTAVARERKKLRREHKAARTLGIIMGSFIVCWLPFFLWYTITNLCGTERCSHPVILVDILFWIGYFNSTMNPIIYAFFNREFRTAFKKLLRCCPTPPRTLTMFCDRLSSRKDSFSDEGPTGLTIGDKSGHRSRGQRETSHSLIAYTNVNSNNNSSVGSRTPALTSKRTDPFLSPTDV